MIGLLYTMLFLACVGPPDGRSEEMCIGHSAISKSRLSDGMQSEAAENITKVAPIDNERLECMYSIFQHNNCITYVTLFIVVTSSVPDCDNDHNENGKCILNGLCTRRNMFSCELI